VLDIIGPLRYLLSKTGNLRVVIEEALKKKDYEQLVNAVKHAKTSKGIKKALLALPELYGGRDILIKAKSIGLLKKYVYELEDVLYVLDEFGLDCKVNIDLGELRVLIIIFEVTFEIISLHFLSPS
jgi:ATP phosphoribosyltransferase regulatory subunit